MGKDAAKLEAELNAKLGADVEEPTAERKVVSYDVDAYKKTAKLLTEILIENEREDRQDQFRNTTEPERRHATS